MTIDFDSLAGTLDDVACDIRRLSTVSYVKACPTTLYTTKWQWYWQDESGMWKKYGKEGAEVGHNPYRGVSSIVLLLQNQLLQ